MTAPLTISLKVDTSRVAAAVLRFSESVRALGEAFSGVSYRVIIRRRRYKRSQARSHRNQPTMWKSYPSFFSGGSSNRKFNKHGRVGCRVAKRKAGYWAGAR